MKCPEIGFAILLFGSGVFLWGCKPSASSVAEEHADSADSHQHEAGHSHDHPHPHDHPHGSPVRGGQIVAIGHSHHGRGETHYHAEIMPLADGKITFHVLTEDGHGETQPAGVATEKIRAYVDPLDRDSVQAVEVVFSATKNSDGSTFTATIPELLQDSKRLSVIVPKIELGGERLNFSFKASTTATPAQSEKMAAGDSK